MRGAKPHLVVDNDPVDTATPAPSWLSEFAQAEWNRVYPGLVERRILITADLASLENYCVAIGQVRECEAILQREGPVIDTDGGKKRHPASIVQSDAMNRARQLAGELGLTPSTRSRAAIRPKGEGDDGLVLA